MSDQAADTKLEVKQASKEVKESENVAEKYSAMTVKNSEMSLGELSSSFSAVPTHKPVKKVSVILIPPRNALHYHAARRKVSGISFPAPTGW